MPLALSYFSRLRLVDRLLPAVNRSDNARVITILGTGIEREIDVNDIEVKNEFSVMKAAQIAPMRKSIYHQLFDSRHGSANVLMATVNTLAFSQLSQSNPKISFIHVSPGIFLPHAMYPSTWSICSTTHIFLSYIFTSVLTLRPRSILTSSIQAQYLVCSALLPHSPLPHLLH